VPPSILFRLPLLCQNGGLSVLSSIGETEKGRVDGGTTVEKGSMKWCIVLMQQPVLLSPKFGAKSSHISSSLRKTSQLYAEFIVCRTRQNSLWTIHLIIKENDEHALYFALHLSRLFRSRWVWTFCVRLMLYSLNSCLITVRVFVSRFPTFARNVMLFLCQIHCEISSGQILYSK
jgi:hypothetical protein